MRKEPQKSRSFKALAADESAAAGRPTAPREEAEANEMKHCGKDALGRLVLSKAGHDKGTYLVIAGIADESRVLVADGERRRIEKPKPKKLRHLVITDRASEELRQKLLDDRPIGNAELRKFIASCVSAGENKSGKEE